MHMVMKRGKQTCMLLREIRRQIAEANGIDYVTRECRYNGDCSGTCPKCEAEVRWLERRLQTRMSAGKAVALAGISVGLLAGYGYAFGGNNIKTDTLQEYEPAQANRITKVLNEKSVEDKSRQSMTVQDAVVCGGVDDEDNPLLYDKQAHFPGGIDALMKFLSDNISYPKKAIEEEIQGRVVVKFIVNEAGRVIDAIIAESVNPLLDDEALRVVRKLPRFIPAEYKGKNKSSYWALPINFSFSEMTDSLKSVAADE